MSATTNDCKIFLENQVSTKNQGPWKRLFKRKDANGDWMRGFSNMSQTLFVLLNESSTGALNLVGTCNSEMVLEAMSKALTAAPVAAPPANAPLSLFQQYPPNAYDLSHHTVFTGRIIVCDFQSEENTGEGVQFMLTYETDDGVYDDHSTEIDKLVKAVLGPVFGSNLLVSIQEGTHCVRTYGQVFEDDSTPAYQQLADKIRRTLVLAGVIPLDGDFYDSNNDPNKSPSGKFKI